MKNRHFLFPAALIVASLYTSSLYASRRTQWSIQVEPIQNGEVALAPEFKIAIYENLLEELNKTKQFHSVFRSGDSNANGLANLLTLKTTVEAYTAGSETRRAVTTVSGATKLKVRSQLITPDGHVSLERVVDGNVRFFGSNLRATHNLAHNLAKAVEESALPDVPAPSSQQ